MADENYYRALLDGNWNLRDLYEIPHAYAQNYAFIYCFDSDLSPRDRDRINYALEGYPWRGGYSYVNIYTVLQNQVPNRDRPRIKSISKSSPGWLDLFLNVEVAYQLAFAVAVLSASGIAATVTYKNASKYLSDISLDRKRRRIEELRLSREEAKIITSMCLDLAKDLGFSDIKSLHQYTGNEEVTLKLLLAHYRRISILVDYVNKGKLILPHRDGLLK